MCSCVPCPVLGDQRRRPNAHPIGQRDQHVIRGIEPPRFEAADSSLADVRSGGKLGDANSLLLAHVLELLSEADQLGLLVHGFLS